MAADGKWWGSRVVHEFNLPERLRAVAGCSRVGLVELTFDEEEQAVTATKTALAMAQMLTRMSVATMDGKAVEQNGPEANALLDCSPVVRVLLSQARQKVSQPTDEEIEAFLRGERLSV